MLSSIHSFYATNIPVRMPALKFVKSVCEIHIVI